MCGTNSTFRHQVVTFVYCITLRDWVSEREQEPERRDLNPSEVRNVRLLQYLFKLRAKKNNINENNMFFCLKY